jgi:predicted nucleic acid-binding protein
MKLILDASIAVKWFLSEPDSPAAIKLQEDFHRGIHQLLAPDILPVEVTHALTRAERRGVLFPGETSGLLPELLLNGPGLYSYLDLLPRAVEISSMARIGVYDCLYVALAEKERCELVTADEKLIKNLSGYPIISLASL